jgi:phage baseplate assembly protein gpV
VLSIDRAMQQALRASKILGVWPAIVSDNKDGQDNPGYRVKVKFPWLSDQETTFWARIAIPMAGPERGTYVLPEIDDQVLVVFEHGDIDRPIVVGALWSKQQEPVEVNQSGKNHTKLIKSRCGHRIIFDDQQGGETITIVDRTNKNKIVLDSVHKIVKIESDGDIEVKARANVIVHANALKVGTSQGVTGKAQSLLAHAQKTFGLKATSGITIGGGTTTINVSNAAATRVSGSGAGELGAPGEEQPGDQVAEQTRGGGGSSAGGSGGGGGAQGSPAARATAVASAAPGAEAPAAPASTPPRPDDDHVYVIHARLSAPGGNPLGDEQVIVLKAGTTEQIAGPFTTDAQGGFAAIVPENTPYDVQILDTEHAPPVRSSSDDAVQNHLHVGVFENGVPLALERVTVVGPDGSARELTLSADGMLDLVADPGEHQITVRGETFHAHTLTAADLGDGGSHYEFAVRPAPPDLETARAGRYSPGPDHDDGEDGSDDEGVA